MSIDVFRVIEVRKDNAWHLIKWYTKWDENAFYAKYGDSKPIESSIGKLKEWCILNDNPLELRDNFLGHNSFNNSNIGNKGFPNDMSSETAEIVKEFGNGNCCETYYTLDEVEKMLETIRLEKEKDENRFKEDNLLKKLRLIFGPKDKPTDDEYDEEGETMGYHNDKINALESELEIVHTMVENCGETIYDNSNIRVIAWMC